MSKESINKESMDAQKETCPICFEIKTNVQILEHWEPRGDISGHKMCNDCKEKYHSNECPFCKEVLRKQEFLDFIAGFVRSWRSIARDDHNAMAAVFERWQYLEMELDGKPMLIQRLARLIIEDPQFSMSLRRGVAERQEWVRDISGIIFRFWSLIKDESMLLAPTDAQLIDQAVEMILEPFERTSFPVQLNGHFYGALYMQVLTPWLCANAAGHNTQQLRQLVQRTGRAIVHCFTCYSSNKLKREIKERMHVSYIQVAQESVWGNDTCDIVWKTFYA